jgi:folylpolyglutamate synthase/dihydrofolate synthase
MDATQQLGLRSGSSLAKKQRNYGEITSYLDAHWKVPADKTLQRMVQLDKALQSPSRKFPAMLVAGTNGKSLTIDFAARLLSNEGLTVGAYTTPYILLYKEQISINGKSIPSKLFAELGNDVIGAIEDLGIEAHTSELLTMIAVLAFQRHNVDVAIFEVNSLTSSSDPVAIVDAKVGCITRVTQHHATMTEDQLADVAQQMVTMVKPDMYVISGDQSKATLQLLQKEVARLRGHWAMPVRKLATLAYPFEQLHGRCAALAERIAQLFVERHIDRSLVSEENSLLVRRAGQRGRPTRAAKRMQELNPRKTIEQFWKETSTELAGKFQLLDKEKPSVLLDTAANVDAFKNLLLGIRLLHYQRPLKGLAIVVGATKDTMYNEEFLKLVRYFFKKMSGHMFICPPGEAVPGCQEESSWNVETVETAIKAMKVKARSCRSLEEAFELAKKSVDERDGLVVLCGSQSIVAAYWNLKGIKKL